MHAFGNNQVVTAMATRSVHHENNLFARPCLGRLSELLESLIVESRVHPGQEQEEGASRLRLNEAIQIEPLIPGFDDAHRTRTPLDPSPPNNRQQPNPVF